MDTHSFIPQSLVRVLVGYVLFFVWHLFFSGPGAASVQARPTAGRGQVRSPLVLTQRGSCHRAHSPSPTPEVHTHRDSAKGIHRGSMHFSCKHPDCKCFTLCGSRGLCFTPSTLPELGRRTQTPCHERTRCVPVKPHSQEQAVSRPGPGGHGSHVPEHR